VKIAIVGSGISGLICAHLLNQEHEVTLFEANSKPGGHVNTIEVESQTGTLQIDTGFIVFNELNYPNFLRLLNKLNITTQPTRMGFSVRSESLGLEYSGESAMGFFGHFRNITDPLHWNMLRDILRFHQKAVLVEDPTETVEQFLSRHKFGTRFRENFLLPLGSALWSCSLDRFGSFPMEFVTGFLANHQMLQAFKRPVWRVIKGGSKNYVTKIVEDLGASLRLNTPIQKVSRQNEGVFLSFKDGTSEFFSEVILACHADQSLRLLDSPTSGEISLLENFPYEKNKVTLHGDDSLLPRRKSVRASWNAYVPKERQNHAVVTYDMNILQNLPTNEPFCVSLNQQSSICDNAIHQNFEFSHPTYHAGRKDAQKQHDSLIRNRGISLCGSYWGYGFHEDGLNSGLRVCKAFGASL